jgi:SAM-dependent methyltransferase
MSVGSDVWASGTAYEQYVGRWSRRVAAEFLRWLCMPRGMSWIDVGCGTGALAETILYSLDPVSIVGVDRSRPYVQQTPDRVRDHRVRVIVGDGQQLPLRSGVADVAVSGLVLNFMSRPEAMLAEMTRVVRREGMVAAYAWDYAAGMQLMRYFWDAAVALNPSAEELDEGRRFPICNPQRLEALFRDVGLAHVESRGIDVRTRFENFDDYWSPFLGGQGPAPGYAMSLSEAERAELRERIRRALPVRADGSIDLTARAWAVRGSRSA